VPEAQLCCIEWWSFLDSGTVVLGQRIVIDNDDQGPVRALLDLKAPAAFGAVDCR
jgi:hypothetical protein